MDARKVTELVVEYFQKVSGVGPLAFGVESVRREGKNWLVTCSMFEYFGARERSTFKVTVDSVTGAIQNVEKVAAADVPRTRGASA